VIPDGSRQISLFPQSLDLGADQMPGEGACRHPIGRRRWARAAPTKRRSARPARELAEAIGALRAVAEAQGSLLVDIGAAIEQVGAELRVVAGERRRTNERIDAVLRALTELRRGLGQTALHEIPRHTRRRPLAP
jgi:hypothetical protein